MSKFIFDPRTGKYKLDYASLSETEISEMIKASKDQDAKAREILAELLPASAAQALLTKGAVGAYELLIKLAKRSPEKLLELIV